MLKSLVGALTATLTVTYAQGDGHSTALQGCFMEFPNTGGMMVMNEYDKAAHDICDLRISTSGECIIGMPQPAMIFRGKSWLDSYG